MRKSAEECPIDMTPMIDVVFQLIIFFTVTIRLDQTTNPDIELELAANGPEIKRVTEQTMVVEVDKKGGLTMHGMRMSVSQFAGFIQNRFNRTGEFPLLIRGDWRTQHKDIRRVMDACTEIGLYRISFAAIKEKKGM